MARKRSHNMHPFIDVLLAATERPDKDGQGLADRLHDSFSAKWETYDGTLVNELMTMIDVVVEQTPEEEDREAYNLLAEQHGVDPLEKGEKLGGPYSDMFVDAVLDAIKEKRA